MPSSTPENPFDALFRSLTRHERERTDAPRPTGGAGPGSQEGRYETREPLGEGATAVVYRAWDQELKREIALKVLREMVGMSPIARERFRREAQTSAKLVHPNVVAVYDAGEREGSMYLVMELVEGRALSDVMKEGRNLLKLLPLLEQAARGVGVAHSGGVIHRDLKPQNILISASGTAKVGDFGLAHLVESTTELTRTGTTLGTPLYMSPEQVGGRSKEISPETDVYALGAILYEILCGRPPHVGDTAPELYRKIADEEPAPPRKLDPTVPSDLETVCLKAIEKDPRRRYASANDFADDLARYLRGDLIRARAPGMLETFGRSLRRRRTGVAILLAALLSAAGVGTVAGWRSARSGEREHRYESARQKGDDLWTKTVLVARAGPSAREALQKAAGEALRQFDEAAAAKPTEPYPYLMRGRCLLLLGRPIEAEQALTAALHVRPGYGPALLDRGKYYLGSQAVEQVLRRPRDSRPGRSTIGRTEAEGWEKGRADLESARASTDIESSLLGCLEGMLALGRGDFDHAAAALGTYLAQNPWDVEATALLGAAYYYAGRFSQADEVLTRSLELVPNARWRKWRADARSSAGRYREALEDYDQVLREEPDSVDVLCNRGLARQALGNVSGALEDYAAALERRPGFARAYNSRGTLWFGQLEFEKARKDFEEAVTLDEKYAEAHVNLAKTSLTLGDLPGAFQELDVAIAFAPRYAEAYLNRGLCHEKKGDPDKAIEDFVEAAHLDTADPDSRFRLGLLRKKKGDDVQAITALRQAVEVSSPAWPRRAEAEKLLREWGGK